MYAEKLICKSVEIGLRVLRDYNNFKFMLLSTHTTFASKCCFISTGVHT